MNIPNGYIRTDRLLGFLLKYFVSSSQADQKFSSALQKHNKSDIKNISYFRLLQIAIKKHKQKVKNILFIVKIY